LACLVSILPAAIFADLIVPFTKWHTWYFPDSPLPKQFPRGFQPPRALQIEEAVFRYLVVPPSWTWHQLGGSPAPYAYSYVVPGATIEIAGIPPFALAMYHLRLAAPFWLLVFLLAYELAHQVRSRAIRSRVA
jgi:hypothetical protein